MAAVIETESSSEPSTRAWVDASLRRSFGALDEEGIRRRYAAENEFEFVPDFVEPAMLARLRSELTLPTLKVHRSKLPFVRKAGHIGWRALQKKAPTVVALYESQVFLDWMSDLVGAPMYLKHPEDDHACAAYVYTKRGDGMQYHYDTCGCEEGTSYTMIVSIVDDSSQRFLAKLHKDDPSRANQALSLQTTPGGAVIFCGSKVWHAVSPLGKGERRLVLSLSYATKPTMSHQRRLSENVKDAVLYFGPSALLQRNFTQRSADDTALHVLVTGASSGIGAEVARQYALTGAKLALVARRSEELEETARRCLAHGAREVRVLPADVRDADAAREVVSTLRSSWPRLDRAYLNAGGYGVRGEDALALERDHRWTAAGFRAESAANVMTTNYLGVTNYLDPVLAWMRAMPKSGTPRIAITGAQAADRGYPKHGPYAASKAALRALADALRADAARLGIGLTLIEPGCVESGLTESKCCDEMPFIQPVDRAVRAFVAGVERGAPVVRFPLHGSLSSRFAALVPRPIFDVWAKTKL